MESADSFRLCRRCSQPLPAGSTSRRRYCSTYCKLRFGQDRRFAEGRVSPSLRPRMCLRCHQGPKVCAARGICSACRNAERFGTLRRSYGGRCLAGCGRPGGPQTDYCRTCRARLLRLQRFLERLTDYKLQGLPVLVGALQSMYTATREPIAREGLAVAVRLLQALHEGWVSLMVSANSLRVSQARGRQPREGHAGGFFLPSCADVR